MRAILSSPGKEINVMVAPRIITDTTGASTNKQRRITPRVPSTLKCPWYLVQSTNKNRMPRHSIPIDISSAVRSIGVFLGASDNNVSWERLVRSEIDMTPVGGA